MEKKKVLSIVLLSLLAVGIVGAGIITYYGKITQNVEVEQAVLLDCGESGCIEDVGSLGDSGIAISDIYTLTSNRDFEVPVKLMTEVNPDEDGINSVHLGIARLTQKKVVFGDNHWSEIGDEAIIHYTIDGENFGAEIVEGEKVGYTLIYYKDNSDRFNNPAKVIKIEAVGSNSLPYETDGNLDEYSYCGTVEEGQEEDYTTCHGAKIWYVPEIALSNCNGGECDIDWSQASNFLFETELIEYNQNGEIIVYPDEEFLFYTKTTFSNSNVGDYTITTEAQVQ